jgi:CRISPR-associated protein Cmr4
MHEIFKGALVKTQLLFVHARSPLHAGTGQGVGAIDLPIAREKATGLPYLPGSSLKGPLRDRCHGVDPAVTSVVFGPDTNAASDHSGAAVFSDARLLLLPVRSFAGTFAWVTSPYLLERFLEDAHSCQVKPADTLKVPNPIFNEDQAQGFVAQDASILGVHDNVVLEDLDLELVCDPDTKNWANWLEKLLLMSACPGCHVSNSSDAVDTNPPDQSATRRTPPTLGNVGQIAKRLCIVHDDVMGFLLDTATEVVARVKINDDTKTVQKGGLWYEESLPTESLLVGTVVSIDSPAKNANKKPLRDAEAVATFIYQQAHGKTLQLGGKATVGRGVCRLSLVQGEGQ